jgi:hypothetical protein
MCGRALFVLSQRPLLFATLPPASTWRLADNPPPRHICRTTIALAGFLRSPSRRFWPCEFRGGLSPSAHGRAVGLSHENWTLQTRSRHTVHSKCRAGITKQGQDVYPDEIGGLRQYGSILRTSGYLIMIHVRPEQNPG